MTLEFAQLELFGGAIRLQWVSARISARPPAAPPTKPVVDAEGAVVLPLRPGLAKAALREPLRLVASK